MIAITKAITAAAAIPEAPASAISAPAATPEDTASTASDPADTRFAAEAVIIDVISCTIVPPMPTIPVTNPAVSAIAFS